MIASLAALALVAGVAHAKRPAPAAVAPVVNDGVRYEAPHFAGERSRLRMAASIRAVRVADGRPLWTCPVYYVMYEPGLEQDAQDVHVVGLSISGTVVLVDNEKGERFAFDIGTGAARALRRVAGSRTVPASEPCATARPRAP